MSKLVHRWVDGKREPQHPPNPAFPNGIDVDLARGRKSCETTLPCPAKRCGHWLVHCEKCGYTAVVTTAGRADDPRSVRVPCKESA